MTLTRHLKRITLVIGLVVMAFSVLPDRAVAQQQARALTALNVRSGPGIGFPVVDTLYKGEIVTIDRCRANGWCFIRHKGPNGWVSSKWLGAPATAGNNCGFKLVVTSSGISKLALVCGPGPQTNTVVIKPGKKRACFYKGANYSGASFCQGIGKLNTLNAAFDDKITSVKVFNGARAKLCRKVNMNGLCVVVTSNTPVLPATINNKASSLRVY